MVDRVRGKLLMSLPDDIQARRARKRAEARDITSAREYLGMPTPLALTRQAVYHWNREDQIKALVAARQNEPEMGFVMRLLALCTLPRTNPGNRDRYIRRNSPFSLIMIAGGEVQSCLTGHCPGCSSRGYAPRPSARNRGRLSSARHCPNSCENSTLIQGPAGDQGAELVSRTRCDGSSAHPSSFRMRTSRGSAHRRRPHRDR